MGERSTPLLLQKEKHGSAKSHVSKMLFPVLGKIKLDPLFVTISYDIGGARNLCFTVAALLKELRNYNHEDFCVRHRNKRKPN